MCFVRGRGFTDSDTGVAKPWLAAVTGRPSCPNTTEKNDRRSHRIRSLISGFHCVDNALQSYRFSPPDAHSDLLIRVYSPIE